jgi:tRNA(Ile)-lysidine synthase
MQKENQYQTPSSALHDFINYVKTQELWKEQDHLYLACSGGMDSVVLAHLLKAAGCRFSILHCNFQLRGAESNRDEMFVRTMAQQMGVDIQIKLFDTKLAMQEGKTGLQETARNLRYAWFNEVIKADTSSAKKWVLTAHHADDQVETMLINFLRGTGIAGLHGMQEKNGLLVRPLLKERRAALLNYATLNQLEWVEDSSNAEINYTRNFLRQAVVPELEKIFPSLKENMLENAKRLSEVEMVYRKMMDIEIAKLIEKRGNSFAISVNKLSQSNPLDTIMYELFSPFGFTAAQISEIKKLFIAGSGKYINSKAYRVLRNRNWLLIEPINLAEQTIKLVEELDTDLILGDAILSFRKVSANTKIDTNPSHAFINLKDIKFPLLVRLWKAGDYFYPLGMKKKKKISRFMTDLKLSLTEKENQWVIESDKKIIWVIGRRIDDRFKIDDNNHEKLHISITRPS